MSTPRVITVVFLSLFLTLALFIFGFLFTMKMTALSTGYVNSHLDSLPLASLVEEAEFDETMEDNPELISLIKDVIIKNEAELKERIGETVYIIYGYLNGKSEELDMALVLKNTILDPDFTISMIERADLTPLVKELVAEMTKGADLPYGLSIEPHIDDITNDLEPWLKEQASAAVHPVYDYILGLRQNTDIIVQLELVRETLRNYLSQDFLDSPPAEYVGLSMVELKQRFNEDIFSDFTTDIWSAIEIDLELMDSDVQSEVAESLAEVEEALSESRKYVGFFNAIYGLLIGLIVLFVAGIILVYRGVKGASRILGGIFLGYGIINLIAIFIARSTIKTQITQLGEIPSSMQTWLTQFAISSLTPLHILTIVLLIVGVALLAVSFIYKRHEPQTGIL
jgi:hypothetical protein